jgi:site-specific recombinase XerD
MPQGRDMPKADTRYLYKRNGRPTWWVKFRVPGTNDTIRRSLKTKDLREAQARRDKLLEQREQLVEQTSYATQLVHLRERYLSSVDDQEREIVRDKIQETSEDMAAEMGLLHLYKGPEGFDPDHLSEEELRPWKAYKTALGELTPIAEVLPVWLETIGNKKTRSDYRRAVEVLSKRFTTLEEVDRRKAKQFLDWAKREYQITNPTLRKWMSGYKNLWEYTDKDKAVWRDQKLSADTPRAKKQPYSVMQVLEMYRILSERNDVTASWLQHAVWIAAHTGARESAIASLRYNAENKTIWFPKAKKEESDRTIPAHSAIWSSLDAWENGCRKSASSISSQFTLFKQSLGYTSEHDFHSFRRTFLTMCENTKIPEGVAADIAGHKKQTISYGLYSGGTSMARMREAIKKISYG